MEPLENDPANPCVGCGPANPRGLRLRFSRDGDAVVAELVADATLEGWPGRLHSGLLYTALLETANWTVFAAKGRVGFPSRTGGLALARFVPTGERLRLEGRVAAEPEGGLAVQTRALDAQGAQVAALDREFLLLGRAELMRRMGYEKLPAVLADLVPE